MELYVEQYVVIRDVVSGVVLKKQRVYAVGRRCTPERICYSHGRYTELSRRYTGYTIVYSPLQSWVW